MKQREGFKIYLGDITKHNVGQLKRLNTVIFPVMYNDKFYKDVLDLGELAQLVYFNDIIVGAVCCRVEKGGPPQNPNTPQANQVPALGFRDKNHKKVYIMTLGCLPKYRRLGVGSRMVEHVFKLCEKIPDVESIYLHVQLDNDSALEFYKKYGFEITATVNGYYKRIEPSSAYILENHVSGSGVNPWRVMLQEKKSTIRTLWNSFSQSGDARLLTHCTFSNGQGHRAASKPLRSFNPNTNMLVAESRLEWSDCCKVNVVGSSHVRRMVDLDLNVPGCEMVGRSGVRLQYFWEEILQLYVSKPTVLLLGGNDLCCHPFKAKSTLNVEDAVSYFAKLKKAYKVKKQELFVCSILMRSLDCCAEPEHNCLQKIPRCNESLQSLFGNNFIGVQKKLRTKFLRGDGVHYDKEGYKLIRNSLIKFLSKRQLIPPKPTEL